MRVMKMVISLTAEGLLPIPDAEHGEYPLGPLDEQVAAKLRDQVIAETRKEYEAQGQRLVSSDMTFEVVEI